MRGQLAKAAGLSFLLLCSVSRVNAGAQVFQQQPLPQKMMTQKEFMQEGYSGSVALVSGSGIASTAAAQRSDSLIPLADGACYRVLNDSRISATGRLYFAINHRLPNANFRNAFVAVQVLRYVPAQSSSSDLAFTRSDGEWIDVRTGRPIGGRQTDMLHIKIDDFVSAHKLVRGVFDEARIQSLFRHTNQGEVTFHARLPRRTQGNKPEGYYSSLDPDLAEQWVGMSVEYKPADRSYAIFMRNYLLSFSFATKSNPAPFAFYTDPVGAENILVRMSASVGSGFGAVNRTFEFAKNSNCLFAKPTNNFLSWLFNR